MAKNKVKKKQDDELIEDEVIYEEEVVGGDDAQDGGELSFFEKYRSLILGGGVLVVVLGLFIAYRSSSNASANVEGQEELALAVSLYERDSFNLALNDNPQSSGLLTIGDEYDGTSAGNLAKYYIGTSYLKMGQIEDGISYLEDFDKGDDMISAAAYAALGFAYEQQNSFAEAAGQYELASRTPAENDFSTPFYLMHAARNHESAGDAEAALNIYKRIKNEFPLSDQAKDGSIDKYIAKLSTEDADE